MKAAVLREVGKPLTIEDVQINKPGPHEVLIRTVAAGVCHSDLHFIEGSYPAQVPVVLGHESAGIVEQVGSEVRTVKAGRSRHHLPVGLLRPLRALPHRPHVALPEPGRPSARPARSRACRSGAGPMNQFLNLSSFAEQMLIHQHACVDGPQGHAARPRRADRLRR